MRGAGARCDDGPSDDRAVLAAAGTEKSYRRGVWPARRRVRVLQGVDLALAPGEAADTAELLGGPGGPAVQTATAGWAAGFIAAIAMYVQMRAARAADRCLVLAGLAASRPVAARNRVLWALLIAVPVVFVLLAVATEVHRRNERRKEG